MYPFFRLIKSVVQGVFGKRIDLTDVAELSFWIRPYDMDWLLELNNGRILTLCDMGWIHLAMKVGLGKPCLRQKWGVVVAGTSVQYRKNAFVHFVVCG